MSFGRVGRSGRLEFLAAPVINRCISGGTIGKRGTARQYK